MSAIEWRRGRQRLLLDILIFPPEANDLRSVQATALVDTGATTSAVTGDVARQLDLAVVGKRTIASAHGDANVDRYLFRVGLLADQVASGTSQLPFIFDAVDGFHIRDGFAFNALLGMDILSQCDLRLTRDGRCLLEFG